MPSRRLLLAIALSFAAATAFAQGPDPAQIVKSIYDSKDRYGAAGSLEMRAKARPALSKSFAALWKRSDDRTPAEDEPVPGFDIASNSQGLEIARAEVKVERQDAQRATVVAKLIPGAPFHRNSPEENVVRYDFVRENGHWKIDDVRTTNGTKPWSARKTFTKSLARQ